MLVYVICLPQDFFKFKIAPGTNQSSKSPLMDWVHGACACVVLVVTWLLALPGVAGHGRLLDPPSRSSMWRVGFNNPPNYDDNQLFCGGVAVSISRQTLHAFHFLTVCLISFGHSCQTCADFEHFVLRLLKLLNICVKFMGFFLTFVFPNPHLL